jgi:hypothetical protein
MYVNYVRMYIMYVCTLCMYVHYPVSDRKFENFEFLPNLWMVFHQLVSRGINTYMR